MTKALYHMNKTEWQTQVNLPLVENILASMLSGSFVKVVLLIRKKFYTTKQQYDATNQNNT